jgi:hypothetical protein
MEKKLFFAVLLLNTLVNQAWKTAGIMPMLPETVD